MITPGETGWLISVHDAEAFAIAIVALAEDTRLARTMTRGRDRIASASTPRSGCRSLMPRSWPKLADEKSTRDSLS
jgi:glycosyltransferase involved in cell wall biosynthesis